MTSTESSPVPISSPESTESVHLVRVPAEDGSWQYVTVDRRWLIKQGAVSCAASSWWGVFYRGEEAVQAKTLKTAKAFIADRDAALAENDAKNLGLDTADVAQKLQLVVELDYNVRVYASEMQMAHDTFQESWDTLSGLIDEAKGLDERYFQLLGFASWTAWLVDAVHLTPTNVVERKQCVILLVEAGLSYRAIAEILGVSKSQIQRVVGQLEDDGELSHDGTVESLDGHRRPRKRPPKPPLTPKRRYTKVYNALSQDVSRMIDHIAKDAEFASVAKDDIDHLVELRDGLTKTIGRLRSGSLVHQNRVAFLDRPKRAGGTVVALDDHRSTS